VWDGNGDSYQGDPLLYPRSISRSWALPSAVVEAKGLLAVLIVYGLLHGPCLEGAEAYVGPGRSTRNRK
jgi:hypothetical protein